MAERKLFPEDVYPEHYKRNSYGECHELLTILNGLGIPFITPQGIRFLSYRCGDGCSISTPLSHKGVRPRAASQYYNKRQKAPSESALRSAFLIFKSQANRSTRDVHLRIAASEGSIHSYADRIRYENVNAAQPHTPHSKTHFASSPLARRLGPFRKMRSPPTRRRQPTFKNSYFASSPLAHRSGPFRKMRSPLPGATADVQKTAICVIAPGSPIGSVPQMRSLPAGAADDVQKQLFCVMSHGSPIGSVPQNALSPTRRDSPTFKNSYFAS